MRKSREGAALFQGTVKKGLLIAPIHNPAIDVAEHVGVQAVSGRVAVEANVESSRVEETEIAARRGKRNHRIGNAVTDERPQLTDVGQAEEETASGGQGTVQRNHTGKTVRKAQAQPVSERCPFTNAGQINSLRMDVIVAARLLDGAENIVFSNRIALAIGPPGVTGFTIRPLAGQLRAAQP